MGGHFFGGDTFLFVLMFNLYDIIKSVFKNLFIIFMFYL